MNGYENGISTRKMILNACEELFYEKGYHETGYDDICKAAHVNRGTIYYHFKAKANIRYEVLWEMTTRCVEAARAYCDNEAYVFLVGTYIFWGKTIQDPKLRKFELDYYKDHPVYTPNNPVGIYYKMTTKNMYENIWNLDGIKPLAFATAYGNIYGVLRLMDDNPDAYTLGELYQTVITSSSLTWGVPRADVEELLKNIQEYVKNIPEEVFTEK